MGSIFFFFSINNKISMVFGRSDCGVRFERFGFSPGSGDGGGLGSRCEGYTVAPSGD
jgi:hypothetical protein